MAGIFSIFVKDEAVKAKLAALDQAAGDTREIFSRVGEAILTLIRLGFKVSKDPWGHTWPAPKLRQGQPLRDTGRLQRSITSRPDAEGVTIGTNLIYAPIHQFGGTIKAKKAKFLAIPNGSGGIFLKKKVKIPKRSYLPLLSGGQVALPPQWQAAAVARVKAHLLGAVKEAV